MNTVLITGCSSGIGRALCNTFLTQGFKVYASARNLASLDDLSDHPNLTRLSLDVNNASSIHNAVAAIKQDCTKLNILVNNAGYAAMGPLLDMPIEDLRAQFETNVFAPMEVTKACLELLMKSANAQVVNIGSVSGIG